MNIYSDKVLRALYWADLTRLNAAELREEYPQSEFIESTITDTQGFALILGRVLTITFRGSQQAQDWLTNFSTWHTTYPYDNTDSDIRVHAGFIAAYKSVRDKVHLVLQSHEKEFDKVFVCGHSLGGALATLCAVDIQYNFPQYLLEAWPTANPKVGNKAFVKSFNRRVPNCIRTYMRTDLVPELPPCWTKGGYKHAGRPNPIGPRNILVGLKNWISTHFKLGFPESVTNHAIALYKDYA